MQSDDRRGGSVPVKSDRWMRRFKIWKISCCDLRSVARPDRMDFEILMAESYWKEFAYVLGEIRENVCQRLRLLHSAQKYLQISLGLLENLKCFALLYKMVKPIKVFVKGSIILTLWWTSCSFCTRERSRRLIVQWNSIYAQLNTKCYIKLLKCFIFVSKSFQTFCNSHDWYWYVPVYKK